MEHPKSAHSNLKSKHEQEDSHQVLDSTQHVLEGELTMHENEHEPPKNPWEGKTEDEIMDFGALNEELCNAILDAVEEIDGQRTLDAIKESIGKPAS
jgi:hypothetical protein